MAEEEKKEEEAEEKEEEIKSPSWLPKVILIFLPLLIFFGIYFILNYFRIFILRFFLNEFFATAFIILFSLFVSSLSCFIISQIVYEKLSKLFLILLILSSIGVVGDLLVWAFSYGPLKGFGENIHLFFDKTKDAISLWLCRINPERVASGNFEECEPKDYEKIGFYDGVAITFNDPQYGSNSQPTAGSGYKLRVFLTNKNIQPKDELLKKSSYDIKVKEVIGLASPSPIEESEEYIYRYTTISTKEIVLPPGETTQVILNFQQLPSECQGVMYFKVIVKTIQNSRGKSEFLFLPELSEEARHPFKAIKFTSPGPIDVVTYVLPPNVITQEDMNDASIHISIKNKRDVAKINSIRLLIQRDYVEKVKDCTDDELKPIGISLCNSKDAAVCVDFNLKDEVILKGEDAYNIECKLSFDKSKYKEAEQKSFIVAEVNYDYNYEEYFSISAKKCKAVKPRTTTTIGKCELPNVCYKSCPEGYVETVGMCEGVDTVCCAPISSLECEDIQENCPRPEEVFSKIACEAKKAGVPADIMIGIAAYESSGGYHCDKNGKVISGDEGRSIGLMQVNRDTCSKLGFDATNVNENIRCAISIFMDKCNNAKSYATGAGFSCTGEGTCKDYQLSCTYDCSQYASEAEGGIKEYRGWDLAIRGYNGWGCCAKDGCYSPVAIRVRSYVEDVRDRAAQYGQKYV
jgi:hypothetical protein